ncbi:23S rRNA (adenine(1618)-N(6))-methyltransferase RlmF [Algivirga pacifica]|uniref:Ribosomal RNA large subunit methyltransferase F n=1 Tax=Algivirga pacifica TaxID=1162670 RepID=A0ABP9DD54_9BACT
MKAAASPKKALHPRNLHAEGYPLAALVETYPPLKDYLISTIGGEESIDFSNPDAVVALNKALLLHYYDIEEWELPKGYLCPPIPGRADYIHYAADLLADDLDGKVPKGNTVHVLDIGTGANCIYPILGNRIYGWSFVGVELEQGALEIAQKNSTSPSLKGGITLRKQPSAAGVIEGAILEGDHFALSMCNPPFYSSKEEAEKTNLRKQRKLSGKSSKEVHLNFGGQSNELWTKGGEALFLKKMIKQSTSYKENCLWFTSLVSRKEHLPKLEQLLKKAKAVEVKTVVMTQGQKESRFIAWTFLNQAERNAWWKDRQD